MGNCLKSNNKETAKEAAPVVISNKACFGAGCYWGTEKYFATNFKTLHPESNIVGQVGFMGPKGSKENPTYKEVCTGETGQVEVYHFEYEGGAEMYERLVKYFFQFHDPTTPNRQENDKGTQYASVIYVFDEEQKRIAQKIKKELQAILDKNLVTTYADTVVATDIREATVFFPAHEEHQEYLLKNPKGYCNHKIRIKEWPTLPEESKVA